MKTTFFGIASVALFALTNLVVASPAPIPETAVVKKEAQYEELDVIMSELISSVKTTDATYNTTCSGSCSASQISSWCGEVVVSCNTAISKCKQLPSGYTFPDKDKCVGLVVELLVELQYTLAFLLSKAGLLGLLGSILSLVATLVAVLNALLAEVAIFVDGLLAAVSVLLFEVIGALGCLLCTLGLILV